MNAGLRVELIGALLVASTLFAPALSAQEVDARDKLSDAIAAASRGESEVADRLASEAIALDAKLSSAYYLRGRERFKLGRFAESVADFDYYVELVPDAASSQWERGISLYYAGEYAKGAEQFALYQTYHDADVENAAWRYLCVARAEGAERSEGVAEAKRSLLPIENDRRIPMMAIYRLYKGEATPEDVLAAAKAGEPEKEELAGRMFYARLYLGLWYEAQGNDELARKYLLEAADEHKDTTAINRYMYAVARIHAAKLRKESSLPKTDEPAAPSEATRP